MMDELRSASLEGGMAEHTLGVIRPAFVEPVHVELTYERVHFVVAEVLGQYYLLELGDILDDELCARGSPICNLGEIFILHPTTSTLSISKVFAMNPATSLV